MLILIVRVGFALAALAGIGACSADRAVRPGVALAPEAGKHFRDFADAPEMVVVPAGRFIMGSPPEELGRDPDEGPQREIVIARPFAVGRFAVTRGQYGAFVRATNRPDGPDCYADRGHSGTWKYEKGLTWHDPGFRQTPLDPAVCINMDDVRAYIAWLNARTKGGYRLLSEAEYEYAARAGATTRFPWGDTVTHSLANLGGDPCCGGKVEGHDRWMYTSPGGAFGANRFGLSDMQGNIWEFVADCYTPTLAAVPADGAAVITDPCEKNVIRGAGWDDPPSYLRSANRYKQLPTIRGSVTGFRLARTLG
jgi:formylglycine-generating enzyme required for sulfatase activity